MYFIHSRSQSLFGLRLVEERSLSEVLRRRRTSTSQKSYVNQSFKRRTSPNTCPTAFGRREVWEQEKRILCIFKKNEKSSECKCHYLYHHLQRNCSGHAHNIIRIIEREISSLIYACTKIRIADHSLGNGGGVSYLL